MNFRVSVDNLTSLNLSSRIALNRIMEIYEENTTENTFFNSCQTFLQEKFDLLSVLKFIMSCTGLKLSTEVETYPDDEDMQTLLNNYPKSFTDFMKAKNVLGDGNCFYYSISLQLFGEFQYSDIIRLGIVAAFFRNITLLNEMTGEDSRSFCRLVCPDKIWADVSVYAATSIACHRPFYCFAIEPYTSFNMDNFKTSKRWNLNQVFNMINVPLHNTNIFQHYRNYTPFTQATNVSRTPIQVIFRVGHFNALCAVRHLEEIDVRYSRQASIFDHHLSHEDEMSENNFLAEQLNSLQGRSNNWVQNL